MKKSLGQLIGERIADARFEAQMKQDALALVVGIGQDMISRYETGAVLPPIDRLESIAKALKKPLWWFFRPPTELQDDINIELIKMRQEVAGLRSLLVANIHESHALYDSGLHRLPLLGHSSAGNWTWDPDTDLKPYIDVPPQYAQANNGVIQINGDSMYPTLMDGDLMIIKITREAEDGNIVVAHNDLHDITVKRLHLINGQFFLKPDNPQFQMEPLCNWVIAGIGLMIMRDVM